MVLSLWLSFLALSALQHSLFSDSSCAGFTQLHIKSEFWWPLSKCFLLSLINPGPHGTQVQASDVFNSCAHRKRRHKLRIVHVFNLEIS